MTLGENIWAASLLKWQERQNELVTLGDLLTLGEIVIAAIDETVNDLALDHLAEITAMEADRC